MFNQLMKFLMLIAVLAGLAACVYAWLTKGVEVPNLIWGGLVTLLTLMWNTVAKGEPKAIDVDTSPRKERAAPKKRKTPIQPPAPTTQVPEDKEKANA